MLVYLLLLIAVFALLLYFMIYIIRLSLKIVKKYVSNKLIYWILSFVPIFLFIIGLVIDPINAIVVDIHLIVLVLLTKLFFIIVKKITKKEFSEYFVLLIGVIISLLVLIPAYHRAYNVHQTKYLVYTSKDINTNKIRIVQISDSHIGTTMNGKKFSKYMEEINKLNPDIVVITGDYIDDNTAYEDMIDASKGLGKLKTRYGIYFILGNHDKGYFNNKDYNYSNLQKELKKNNVTILEDDYINITDNIILVGRRDNSDIDRKSIVDLTKDLDKTKYIITLDHQPNDYENEIKAETDLVLSGHTHGGHLFPLGEIGVFLGANDKAYGMETRNNTTFIVNSGISGWAIKFRTKSIAEYGIIDIIKK